MKIICFIKGIIRSLKCFNIVSGHDYKEIYDNKDLQVLQCINCKHISTSFYTDKYIMEEEN